LAAQAGTQGRGFRIVADEIKELSERTAASTREIEDMIKAVREDVAEAIERVAVGGERADEGVELASRASELLAEIRVKTNAASDRIRLIADATAVQATESHIVLEAVELVRQQARGIERATSEQALTSRHIGERALHMSELTEQVLRAIETIKEVVGRNQASISGINSAVDLLVREAELLNREVEAFSLPVAERGGHLRFALRTSQLALDPATLSSISRIEVMSNVF